MRFPEIHVHLHVHGNITVSPIADLNQGFTIEVGPFEERTSATMPTALPPITMTDQQEVDFLLKGAKDKAQNPMPFSGPLTATPSDPDAFVITQPDATQTGLFRVKATPTPGHLGAFFIDFSDGKVTKRQVITVATGDEDDLDIEVGTPQEATETPTAETPPANENPDQTPEQTPDQPPIGAGEATETGG